MQSCLIYDSCHISGKLLVALLKSDAWDVSYVVDHATIEADVERLKCDVLVYHSDDDVYDAADTIQRIKALPAAPYVMYCSDDLNVTEMVKHHHIQADDFLMRPFDRITLRAKLTLAGHTE